MRSFSAQERERQDDNDFELATNKTPEEAVRKHSSKAPPPLPTTVAELLQLMWRMIILTTGLFITDCSLAIQLRDMHHALQEREQMLMGDLEAADELIPQLAWAVTTAARKFYGIISTRADVDPPPDNAAPQVAIAQLSIHTQLFKAGIKLNLTNLPEQWRRRHHQQPDMATKSEKRGSGGGKQSDNSDDKRHGSNPFQAATNTGKSFTGRHNPNAPTAFNTPELQQLKAKMSNVRLSDIVHEAGIKGGPSQLTTTGWPNKLSLNWACMGKCPKYKCMFDNPTSIDNAVAAIVYQQLEPGIKRLLETGKRPKRE